MEHTESPWLVSLAHVEQRSFFPALLAPNIWAIQQESSNRWMFLQGTSASWAQTMTWHTSTVASIENRDCLNQNSRGVPGFQTSCHKMVPAGPNSTKLFWIGIYMLNDNHNQQRDALPGRELKLNSWWPVWTNRKNAQHRPVHPIPVEIGLRLSSPGGKSFSKPLP